jgi:hypothetical protein
MHEQFYREFPIQDDQQYKANEYLYTCDAIADERFKKTPRYTNFSEGTYILFQVVMLTPRRYR